MIKKWKPFLSKRIGFYQIYKKFIETEVCIVGAGPVGLTLSNLLTKYKIKNIVIEKDKQISPHPKAHYISYKTMEYFKQLNIEQTVLSYITDIKNWRYYSYCQYILDNDSYLGKIDHFPNPTNSLNYLKDISNSTPIHLPQNKLCRIILDNIKTLEDYNSYNTLMFNTTFIGYQYNEGEKENLSIKVIDNNSNHEKLIKCRYLVGSDGAHSKIRESIGSNIHSHSESHDFINFHFKSQSLAQQIASKNLQSMLYFIFNEYHITVLIAYDLQEGEFVLQIPFYPPIQSISDYTKEKCLNILQTILSKREETAVNDIQVLNISNWKMRNSLTDKLFKDNVFLIGDSAHQFPPSGGYGLNTGIFDTMNLFWRLIILYKNQNLSQTQIEQIKKTFESDCKINAKYVSRCAEMNFSKYLKIVEKLGLKTEYSSFLKNVIGNYVPQSLQKVSLEKTFSIGIYSIKFHPTYRIINHLKEKKNVLNLLFPYVDYCINYYDESLNDFHKYEQFEINFKDYLAEGYILPNFKMNTKLFGSISARDYLRTLLDKEISFFVLRNTNKEIKVEDIMLFKGKIPLLSLPHKLQSFSFKEENCDITFKDNEEISFLNNIGLIIIRPDFIIEKIIKI